MKARRASLARARRGQHEPPSYDRRLRQLSSIAHRQPRRTSEPRSSSRARSRPRRDGIVRGASRPCRALFLRPTRLTASTRTIRALADEAPAAGDDRATTAALMEAGARARSMYRTGATMRRPPRPRRCGRRRRLPGPRASLHRRRARDGHSGALCRRLSLDRRRRRSRPAMPGPRLSRPISAGSASTRPIAAARRGLCARRASVSIMVGGAGPRRAARRGRGDRSSCRRARFARANSSSEPWRFGVRRLRIDDLLRRALRVKDGLVMLSDTRTNAGVDNIAPSRRCISSRSGRALHRADDGRQSRGVAKRS